MRPVEMIFGPTGAQRVEVIDGEHLIVCRNSLEKYESTIAVSYEIAMKVKNWIDAGKPGNIQDVFPELTADQREQMISGITTQEWNEIFGRNYGKEEEVE